ncbi:MAG TPA: response regulator transcription factor [Blastocatellia bacterium]|nr:response regulator transcription factor [Blastocatellia bacterium]
MGVTGNTRRRIVIIEDDEDIANSIKYNLEREATFDVRIANTGEDGLKEIQRALPALVILDINLPLMSGFELCRRLRRDEETARIPILVLTARTDESDRVLGLQLGADDYVVKPFSMRELVARIHAVLRRTEGESVVTPIYEDDNLHIDYDNFVVKVRGADVRLTRKEFALLRLLSEARGRVLTRDYLLDRVWGLDYYGESRTLDVHIRRIRKKLDLEAYIETVIGVGYRFVGQTTAHDDKEKGVVAT